MLSRSHAVLLTLTAVVGRAESPLDLNFPVSVSLHAKAGSPGVMLEWGVTERISSFQPGTDGTFLRQTSAAMATPEGEVVVPPNTPLVEDVVSVSASDGEYLNESGTGRADVVPWFVKDGMLYGTSTHSRVQVSQDGVQWTEVGESSADRLVLLHSGAVLKVGNVGPRTALFRSTDNAMTFTPTVWEDSGTPFEWVTDDAIVSPFGFHQAADGVIIVAEYRNPDGGRYLYRSEDDGVSWKVVFDGQAAGLPLSHYHAVSKHEALGRWVVSTGDGPPNQRYVISDDNGLSWQEYFVRPGQLYSQPTFFLDYGNPTRLLFGSDLAYQVGWVDVSDGPTARQLQSVVTNWDGRPSKNYCFYMWEHDGLFYATSTDQTTSTRNCVISVSADGYKWAVYHRLENADWGITSYAGFFNGRMHLIVQSAAGNRHLAIRPAQLATRPATLISNATANRADPATAEASTTVGWFTSDPQYLSLSPAAHTGETCLRYSRPDGGSMILLSRPVMALPGETIQARYWVRGAGGLCLSRWSVNYADAGETILHGLTRNEWQEVVTRPLTVPANAFMVRLLFLVDSNLSNELEFNIDTIAVEPAPATQWQPAMLERHADVWSVRRAAGPEWTDVFTFRPRVIRDALPEGGPPLHVKSYRLADDGEAAGERPALDVFYLPGGNFRVTYASRSGRSESTYLSADFFQRDAQLRMLVRQANGQLTVGVTDGRPLKTISFSVADPFDAGELEMRVGQASANERTLGAAWLDSVFCDVAVSDSDLGELMRPANLLERMHFTHFLVERRTATDPWAEIGLVSSSARAFMDPDVPADTPVLYRVRPSRDGVAATGGAVALYDRRIDFNQDGTVDVRDHAALMQSYGRCSGDPAYRRACDLDFSGCIGPEDLPRYYEALSLLPKQ